jgi:hypothetical protein
MNRAFLFLAWPGEAMPIVAMFGCWIPDRIREGHRAGLPRFEFLRRRLCTDGGGNKSAGASELWTQSLNLRRLNNLPTTVALLS